MEPPATPRKPRPKATNASGKEDSDTPEIKGRTRKPASSAAESDPGDPGKAKSSGAAKPAASKTASKSAEKPAAAAKPATPKGTAMPPTAASRAPTPAPKPAASAATETSRADSEPDLFKPMPDMTNKPSGSPPMSQRPIIPDNVRTGVTQEVTRLSKSAQEGIVQMRKTLRENAGPMSKSAQEGFQRMGKTVRDSAGPLSKSAQGAGTRLVEILRSLILGVIDISRRALMGTTNAAQRLDTYVRKDDTAVIVTTLLTIAACIILAVAAIAIVRGR